MSKIRKTEFPKNIIPIQSIILLKEITLLTEKDDEESIIDIPNIEFLWKTYLEGK